MSLDAQGRLVVEIHDIGGPFGAYESVETFSVEQTHLLTGMLGKDLVAAIAERFASPAELSAFVESSDIGHGARWNHIDG